MHACGETYTRVEAIDERCSIARGTQRCKGLVRSMVGKMIGGHARSARALAALTKQTARAAVAVAGFTLGTFDKRRQPTRVAIKKFSEPTPSAKTLIRTPLCSCSNRLAARLL